MEFGHGNKTVNIAHYSNEQRVLSDTANVLIRMLNCCYALTGNKTSEGDVNHRPTQSWEKD